jgi:hypothetical protein
VSTKPLVQQRRVVLASAHSSETATNARAEREMRKTSAAALALEKEADKVTLDGPAAFDPAVLSDTALEEYLQIIHTSFAKGAAGYLSLV